MNWYDKFLIWLGEKTLAFIIAIILFFAFILILKPKAAHSMPPAQEIRAILGEAEGLSFIEKQAIAEAIRNRKSLKQVYGLNAVFIKNGIYYRKTRKKTYAIQEKYVKDSIQAWAKARNSNITKGATGWGSDQDIKQFIKEGWWKNAIITKKIGKHTFYKEK